MLHPPRRALTFLGTPGLCPLSPFFALCRYIRRGSECPTCSYYTRVLARGPSCHAPHRCTHYPHTERSRVPASAFPRLNYRALRSFRDNFLRLRPTCPRLLPNLWHLPALPHIHFCPSESGWQSDFYSFCPRSRFRRRGPLSDRLTAPRSVPSAAKALLH